MCRILSLSTIRFYHKALTGLLLSAWMVGSSHAATYHIDPTHTNVRFAIDHFKTSTNTGGFYNLTGQLEYDPVANIGNVSLIIPLNSLMTGDKAFDIALKSADFFDIEKFPLARFESTKWHFQRDKNRPVVTKVDGMLTLHGQTNPVTIKLTHIEQYIKHEKAETYGLSLGFFST